MPTQSIKTYLDQHHVAYATIAHPVAYATREISHVSHIPESQLAKTVVVYAGNKPVLVVVPCCDSIDFFQLKKQLQESDVSLMPEREFSNLFPDCELGAMPPFGDLYHLDVYVDKSLSHHEHISFNAGTHDELIEIKFSDFQSLVHPKMIQLH